MLILFHSIDAFSHKIHFREKNLLQKNNRPASHYRTLNVSYPYTTALLFRELSLIFIELIKWHTIYLTNMKVIVLLLVSLKKLL